MLVDLPSGEGRQTANKTTGGSDVITAWRKHLQGVGPAFHWVIRDGLCKEVTLKAKIRARWEKERQERTWHV